MTVQEAIDLLVQMPKDLEVVFAVDDEGNSFRLVPDDWISVERFDPYEMEPVEDQDDYDNLRDFIVIW